MKQRDILLIVVPTFIMVVLWVAFSVYHNHVSPTVSEPLSLQIEPINKSFDLEALESLKQRERLSPIYERIGAQLPDDISDENSDVATSSSEASESADIEIVEEEL